jgi:hypothetical protein
VRFVMMLLVEGVAGLVLIFFSSDLNVASVCPVDGEVGDAKGFVVGLP